MKIRISDSSDRIDKNIIIPLGFFLNDLTVLGLKKYIRDNYGEEYLPKDNKKLSYIVRKAKKIVRAYKGMKIVEVKSADGDNVDITL
ncbi:MAG: hypothetical protein IJ499_02475 [Clostridia bacterium]|nr:hypothetical protein [Clostridia bacterium]